jgi:hypothetical protein
MSAEQRRLFEETLVEDEASLRAQLEQLKGTGGEDKEAKAIDYSLNNWPALTRNLHDGDVPVSNNHIENLIRPWAVGRKAWLFCGSELAGQRAAMVMSLVQSAELHAAFTHRAVLDFQREAAAFPHAPCGERAVERSDRGAVGWHVRMMQACTTGCIAAAGTPPCVDPLGCSATRAVGSGRNNVHHRTSFNYACRSSHDETPRRPELRPRR